MDNTEPEPASSPALPKARRVPPGWVAPGPPGSTCDVALAADEELSWLLGDWRIIQRRDGHRWSLDDFVTAWVARETGLGRGPPKAILDLGTGIGSVAFMLGWCFPEAHVTGVEAQDVSYKMALRSAVANGVEDRYTFIHKDLRGVFHHRLQPGNSLIPTRNGFACELGKWDLVTGTPPYFDDPEQTRSLGVQKGPCRFEERGGISDYLRAMELALSPHGRAVVCHASRHRERVLAAIAASGLSIERQLEVIPKVDREALVDVFVLAPAPRSTSSATAWEQLVVRDAGDQWTTAFLAARLAMGMPPRP